MPALLFLFGVFLYIYVEISLLVSVGSTIGVFPLIVLMIAISLVGLWLIKLRGLMTIMQIRQQLANGQLPTKAVSSTICFAIAGLLLIIPGFLSDILAILLMLPFTRSLIQKLIMPYITSKITFQSFRYHQHSQRNSNTFEAEFERKPDEDKWLK